MSDPLAGDRISELEQYIEMQRAENYELRQQIATLTAERDALMRESKVVNATLESTQNRLERVMDVSIQNAIERDALQLERAMTTDRTSTDATRRATEGDEQVKVERWTPMNIGTISSEDVTLSVADGELSMIFDAGDDTGVVSVELGDRHRLCALTAVDEPPRADVPVEVREAIATLLKIVTRMGEPIDSSHMILLMNRRDAMDTVTAWLDNASDREAK